MKGPKFREPCKVNWNKTKSMIFEAIDLYAKRWAQRERVELSLLTQWKDKVKSLVESRISRLEKNFKQPSHKIFYQPDVKE